MKLADGASANGRRCPLSSLRQGLAPATELDPSHSLHSKARVDKKKRKKDLQVHTRAPQRCPTELALVFHATHDTG
jgi:hypothetical protein